MDYPTIFKQLSNPIRLRVVALLLEYELCVCALEEITNVRQASISKHLNLLKQAHMVDARREKQRIFYYLTETFKAQAPLLESIASYREKSDLLQEDYARLLNHIKQKDENVYVCESFRKYNQS